MRAYLWAVPLLLITLASDSVRNRIVSVVSAENYPTSVTSSCSSGTDEGMIKCLETSTDKHQRFALEDALTERRSPGGIAYLTRLMLDRENLHVNERHRIAAGLASKWYEINFTSDQLGSMTTYLRNPKYDDRVVYPVITILARNGYQPAASTIASLVHPKNSGNLTEATHSQAVWALGQLGDSRPVDTLIAGAEQQLRRNPPYSEDARQMTKTALELSTPKQLIYVCSAARQIANSDRLRSDDKRYLNREIVKSGCVLLP